LVVRFTHLQVLPNSSTIAAAAAAAASGDDRWIWINYMMGYILSLTKNYKLGVGTSFLREILSREIFL
jgi:hypothetical protein